MWLSFIDEIIINDVLRTHEGYDGRYDTFTGYSEDNLSAMLIAPSPYDRLYTAYLEMKIDEKNGETARYNNSMTLFNTYMMEYRKYYNKTHMPLDVTDKRMQTPPKKPTVGMSDAEYENLKRKLYAMLSEDLSDVTSPDKIQDVIRSFVINNVEMLKPIKGKDYWTEEEQIAIANEVSDEAVRYVQEYLNNKQDKFDEETLEYIAALENLFDRVANNFLILVKKQDKLSDTQIANIDKIPSIEQEVEGADAVAKMAMLTAGNAYDLANGKKDKVKIIYDRTNLQIVYEMIEMDNTELRCMVSLTDLEITFPDGEYSDGYLSGLSFNSGDVPTHVLYAGSGIINWVGVDCTTSEGYSVFQPSANTHYDIVFYYNGTQMIGSVNGFKPAYGN
ncbi:MAG: hypothetical protein J6V23_07060 [Bacteroidaceae bacterium]|nr:hypothetical protein [Bacteroidaceae bacterium]